MKRFMPPPRRNPLIKSRKYLRLGNPAFLHTLGRFQAPLAGCSQPNIADLGLPPEDEPRGRQDMAQAQGSLWFSGALCGRRWRRSFSTAILVTGEVEYICSVANSSSRTGVIATSACPAVSRITRRKMRRYCQYIIANRR